MIKKFIFGLSLLLASAISMAASLNINKATSEEIAEAMTGVGQTKAAAIVKDREQNGEYITLDQLTRVKGIGLATVEKNRDKVSIK